MSFIINPYSFGFNPLSLSPALWLSDTGSDPSVWPDLSGNGRNATQATTNAQPAIVTNARNGRQIRRFDGINDRISANLPISNTPFTIVMVTYLSGSSTGFRVSLVMDSSVFALGYTNVPSAYAFSSTGITLVKARPTNFELISCVSNGVSSSLTIDGVNATGTITAHSSSTLWLGGSPTGVFWMQDCAEILVFPTALSDTDRLSVEAYLRNKWGTP